MSIKKFINKVWAKEDKYGPIHYELTNLQEKVLNMMMEEPYFIGEFQRQTHGKSEMCLMYAVYMAAKYSGKKITLVYSSEGDYRNKLERLKNRLEDTMLLKCKGDGYFRFHNDSTIRMTFNGTDMEESDIVIIDDAAWFEDEKLVEILGKCKEYCDIKLLTSANENGGEEYNKLIKHPDYTYLRYAIEKD